MNHPEQELGMLSPYVNDYGQKPGCSLERLPHFRLVLPVVCGGHLVPSTVRMPVQSTY